MGERGGEKRGFFYFGLLKKQFGEFRVGQKLRGTFGGKCSLKGRNGMCRTEPCANEQHVGEAWGMKKKQQQFENVWTAVGSGQKNANHLLISSIAKLNILAIKNEKLKTK